jgi:hypothetical protein
VLFTTTALVAPVRPAFALSELKNEQGQVPQKPAEDGQTPPVEEEQEETGPLELPLPDPLIRRNQAVTEPSDDAPATDDKADDEPEVPVEFFSDIAKAPEPVRRMRELIVEAAASGDIERLDVLATGFVHVGKGTADEMYVWPYFAEKSLATLTPPEKVELLRIVTAGDFADMKEFGSYNFYRVGITPDGQWKFFVTGD